MEALGYDGYYGSIEVIISAFGSREKAEKAKNQKIESLKEERSAHIIRRYEGGNTYPGGLGAMQESVDNMGKNLFIKEMEVK